MLWQPINLTEACPADTQLTACSNFGYVYLALLVQLFGDSEDRRIQQKLHIKEDTYDEEEYDFIVVGAGAAGCVVANRLSEIKRWKVLLLEAGSEQPDVTLVPGLSTSLLGSSIDWSYQTEPNGKSCLARQGQRCGWPRGKVMGGSSSINSLAYIRGSRVDYDGWAALGNEGWSYEEVLPYFKKSENNLDLEGLNRRYHGVGGEQSVSRYPYIDRPNIMLTKAFHERGLPILDYNGAFQVGAMPSQAFSKDGHRVSTNQAFIQPIRYKRKNLTVKVKAEVFEILIRDNKVAYGVKYTKDGKEHTAYAKKEVIVSGGTINSAKLLMLSGVGPKEHLMSLNITVKQDLAVGENLHDHVTFNGIIVNLPNKTSTLIEQDQILREIKCYKDMKVKRGPLSADGPVTNIAFIKTEPDLPAPDIQYQTGALYHDDYVREPEISDEISIFPTPFYDTLLLRPMNLVPKSRGKLLLNPANPLGEPLLYANYLDDPTDIIPIIKGVRFAISLENTEAFKANGARFDKTPLEACKNYTWGTDEYFYCLARSYTSTTHHQVGTCKMGPNSDPKAVVDPKLRVYGISGLRVIDASIMPFVIRGNTNAPSIMIGEKGVAMVLPYFKKSEKNLNLEGLNRKYHGVDGEQSVSRYPYIDRPSIMMTNAFNERGLPIGDYNARYQMTTMQAQAVSQDGERVSTNNAFIQPIRYKRKNLTVKVNSEVFKVLINKNKVAYGVKYVKDGKVHTAYAKKEVIVSGGSINSPKLLMLSGVGPKEHLSKLHIPVKSDLAVGENLHDHVTFNGIIIGLPNKTSTLVSNTEMMQETYDYRHMKIKDGPLAANGPVNSIAFIKTDPNLPAPDVQFQVDQGNLKEYIREPEIYDEITIFPTSFYNALLPRTMNLVPKSRGKLLLNPANPHGKPLVYANYFDDPRDLIPIVKGVRFLLSLENTEAFKVNGARFVRTPLRACRDYAWGTDEYIVCLARAYTSTTYHPVGTCKMGPKWDRKAVVDSKLRVYGISGLRVIDSSIMPFVIRGNTNAPTIMIGERGVAFVIDDWLNKYH